MGQTPGVFGLKTRAINFRSALINWVRMPVCSALVLFSSAGTFDYCEAWIFLLVISSTTAANYLYLLLNKSTLLDRRLAIGPAAEADKNQRYIQALIFFLFVLALAIPSIDYRESKSAPSLITIFFGNTIVFVGLLIRFWVFRENSFASATIRVEQDQTVVSSGPYSSVRHPMYLSVLIVLLGTPIALGSSWGLVVLPLLTIVIAWRILDEERFLLNALKGYENYTKSVRYRLIPYIW